MRTHSLGNSLVPLTRSAVNKFGLVNMSDWRGASVLVILMSCVYVWSVKVCRGVYYSKIFTARWSGAQYNRMLVSAQLRCSETTLCSSSRLK